MSSDSQIICEFVPPPEPLVPPPEPPPVRRGWPKTAWGVILLIVAFIVTSHYLPVKQLIARIVRGRVSEEQPVVTKTEPAPSNTILALRMQGQLLVAFYNWTQRSDPQYFQSALALDNGPPVQRLSVAVLAGELGSPVKALEQLAELRDEHASNDIALTVTEEETLKTLNQLYIDYDKDRLDAPSVSPEDKAALRAELGWFGDLALAPPGAPVAVRDAVLKPANRFTVALLGGTSAALILAFIGLLGLFLMLLLGLLGYLRGCLQRNAPPVCAVPGHHHLRCGKLGTSKQLIVPADRPASVLEQMVGDPSGEPALQLIHVVESELLNPRPQFRRGIPLLLVGFIAPDRNISRRKKSHDLVEHIIDELQGLIVRVQQPRADPPVRPHGRALAGHAEPRIGSHRGLRMSGEIDLRHDGDEAGGGILHDVAHL